MSEYVNWTNVLTTNLPLGNAMAGLIGADDGDNQTFTKGRTLRAAGGPNTVVAWGAAVPITDRALALIDEFNGPGPYPGLIARGATPELVAQAKAVITIEAGQRAQLFGHAETFWSEHGYEPVQTSVFP
jgi:hypothetical protein